MGQSIAFQRIGKRLVYKRLFLLNVISDVHGFISLSGT